MTLPFALVVFNLQYNILSHCSLKTINFISFHAEGVNIELRRCIDSGPLSQKSAGHMHNRKTKTNTNPSPDPNRYRRRCPDPNARIQKFIHYMAIATFAIADCHRDVQL